MEKREFINSYKYKLTLCSRNTFQKTASLCAEKMPSAIDGVHFHLVVCNWLQFVVAPTAADRGEGMALCPFFDGRRRWSTALINAVSSWGATRCAVACFLFVVCFAGRFAISIFIEIVRRIDVHFAVHKLNKLIDSNWTSYALDRCDSRNVPRGSFYEKRIGCLTVGNFCWESLGKCGESWETTLMSQHPIRNTNRKHNNIIF